MSPVLKKVLLVLIYAGVAARVADMLIISPNRSGVLFALDWPDDPHAIARWVLTLVFGAGWAATLLLFALLGRERHRRVAIGLAIAGLAVFVLWRVPWPWAATTGGACSLVACALATLGLVKREKEDPFVPWLALGCTLLPFGYRAMEIVPWLWVFPCPAIGVLVGWLTAQVFGRERTGSIVLGLAGVLLGSLCLGLEIRKAARGWYGYHISLDCIQFGRIDGDERIDLMSQGYCGMVAGNLYWFKGHGSDFDDWDDRNSIDNLGQICGRMVDLDLDGDADLICAKGIYENRDGSFVCRYRAPMARDENTAEEKIFTALWESHDVVRIDVYAADLDGDGSAEVVAVPKAWARRGLDEIIFCQGKLGGSWTFDAFSVADGAGLENPTGSSPILVLPPEPDRRLVEFLDTNRFRYRVISAPLPEVPESCSTLEYHWLDIDGDRRSELAICREFTKGPGRETKHFGGSGYASPDVCCVQIFRESDGKFVLWTSLETEPFLGSRSNTPMPMQQFGDIDGDGRLDFLGQDGFPYLFKADGTVAKGPRIVLLNGDEMARLHLCDINGDGHLDVISSFQPFWNIRLGPITR